MATPFYSHFTLLGPEALGSKNWKACSDALLALQTACLALDPNTLADVITAVFSIIKKTPGFGPTNPVVLKVPINIPLYELHDLLCVCMFV